VNVISWNIEPVSQLTMLKLKRRPLERHLLYNTKSPFNLFEVVKWMEFHRRDTDIDICMLSFQWCGCGSVSGWCSRFCIWMIVNVSVCWNLSLPIPDIRGTFVPYSYIISFPTLGFDSGLRKYRIFSNLMRTSFLPPCIVRTACTLALSFGQTPALDR
jgi:hypothetical protein